MQQPPDRAIDIAKAMLKRRGVKPYPPADSRDVVHALALTIAATPARGPHGQALVRLFRDYHPYEGVERYILYALRNGHPAYEHVVVQHADQDRQRTRNLADRTRHLHLDGALAAKHVASVAAPRVSGPWPAESSWSRHSRWSGSGARVLSG